MHPPGDPGFALKDVFCAADEQQALCLSPWDHWPQLGCASEILSPAADASGAVLVAQVPARHSCWLEPAHSLFLHLSLSADSSMTHIVSDTVPLLQPLLPPHNPSLR